MIIKPMAEGEHKQQPAFNPAVSATDVPPYQQPPPAFSAADAPPYQQPPPTVRGAYNNAYVASPHTHLYAAPEVTYTGPNYVGYSSTAAQQPPPLAYGGRVVPRQSNYLPQQYQQQPQVIVVEQPILERPHASECYQHYPRPILKKTASQVFSERIKTGYGIIRAILFVLGAVHLGFVAAILDECEYWYYYMAILIFPCVTIIETLLQLFKENNRSWAYSGGNDFAWGILYICQTVAIAVCYYELWLEDYDDTDAFCDTTFDTMLFTTITSGLASLMYWIAGCSVFCCHCLDKNMPDSYNTLP